MQANVERPKCWLRTEEFDKFAFRFQALRNKTQYEIAEMFGINKSTWSSCRTGARPLPIEFIATAMELMPGVPTAYYVSNRRPEVSA